MTGQLYTHVLVPTDYSPASQAAYRVAFAAALGSGATVSLLHVIPEPGEDEYRGLDAIRLLHRAAERIGAEGLIPPAVVADENARHLDRLRAEVHPDWVGPIDLRLEVRRGGVTEEVARYAAEEGVDLIVTGGSRPGLFPDFGRDLTGRLARVTPVKIVRVTPPLPA